ncbi:unnamed protein product [Soboliphyme baturini]|uniref:Uncharacterized protein n=1 Tax=Soboliphyme baturini TaxID=241478 RepID=A0A183IEL0_9BILA|nr:unnamed protein product [Soboliphyme baturini]
MRVRRGAGDEVVHWPFMTFHKRTRQRFETIYETYGFFDHLPALHATPYPGVCFEVNKIVRRNIRESKLSALLVERRFCINLSNDAASRTCEWTADTMTPFDMEFSLPYSEHQNYSCLLYAASSTACR